MTWPARMNPQASRPHRRRAHRRVLVPWLAWALFVVPASVLAAAPVQSVVYVGSTLPTAAGWPDISLAAYHWRAPGRADFSVYAGPHWDFLGDRLTLEVKAGAYTYDGFQPLLNLELLWADGPLALGYFGEVYLDGGHYSWLDSRWVHGIFSAGAMGDLTWDTASRQLAAGFGPEFGIGQSPLDLTLAPTWGLDGVFTMRIFLSLELPSPARRSDGGQ